MIKHISLFAGLSLSLVAFSSTAFSAAQTSVTIEQLSPEVYGSWTFLHADGSSVSSTDAGIDVMKHSFTLTDFAPMTLSVTLPAGMAVKITGYRNGDIFVTQTTPQFSFTPLPNENYRFIVQYSFSLLGSLGVTSNPSSIRFRMKGPSGKIYTSTTPHTFTNLPAGKYALYFPATKDCSQPAVHSAVVTQETRSVANITMACQSNSVSTVDTSRPSKRTLVEAVANRETKPRGERK